MNKRKFYSDGFTLVELLIVIVIIGVLAGISVAAYSGVQKSARDSTVQSDLSNAMKQLAMYEVENGAVPITSADIRSMSIKPTKNAYITGRNNFYYCVNKETGQYALGAVTKDNRRVLAKSSGGIQIGSVGELVVDSMKVCQSIGLTGYDDTNAYTATGYSDSNGWSAWIK